MKKFLISAALLTLLLCMTAAISYADNDWPKCKFCEHELKYYGFASMACYDDFICDNEECEQYNKKVQIYHEMREIADTDLKQCLYCRGIFCDIEFYSVHNVELLYRKGNPNCTVAGWTHDIYYCVNCKRYYLDKEYKEEITATDVEDYRIPPDSKHADIVHCPVKDATCTEAGCEKDHYECGICGNWCEADGALPGLQMFKLLRIITTE